MPARLELRLVDESDGSAVANAQVRTDLKDLPLTFLADSHGMALIELAEPPRHLALRVQREGYVPKLVVWDLQTVNAPWPEHFTLKMERTHTIGGIVRNQRGEPVAGATVLVTLRNASPQGVQPRIHTDLFESPVLTDAEGRWRFDQAPADLSPLWVRLAHPDYISNEHIPTLPAAEEFKSGTAALTIRSGVPCAGEVTDEQDHPLEGVKVILGEGGEDSTTKPSCQTDAEGRFRFGGVAFQPHREPPVLSFNKNGFGPELIQLPQSSAAIRVNVVMRLGKSLRVRFTDADGNPVPGVTMAMSNWRKHRPFNRHFQSDETGLADWENAPADAVSFWILRDGFQRDEVTLTATDDVQTVRLRRPTEISGHVIDARTKERIPHFTVVRGRHFPEKPRVWSHWNFAWPSNFTDGEYRCGAGDPALMNNRDGSAPQQGFRRIRVSAPGYRPAVSRPIANDEEKVQCDFELEPAEPIKGLVRDIHDAPVIGTDIVVAGRGNPVMIESGKVHHRGYFMISTDTEGWYELPPQEENFTVVMAHPEAGYLITSFDELSRSPDVRLLSWGRFELLTTSNKESPSNYFLRPVPRRGNPEERVHYMSRPVMRGDGMLVFEGLPAGDMQLGASGQPMRDTDIITIESGGTVRLDLRSGRRTLVGQILLPSEGIPIEEPLAHLRLRRQRPANVPVDWGRRAEYSETTFQIDLEGRFCIPDVLPGLYKLTAIFFRSLPSRESRPDIAGLVGKDFELPQGEGEYDLGPLPILSPNNPEQP
ncbi:MAG TPA: carboxypeptidase regulatory-like domain-containing protein [Candidatus Methylacidiphilales bacterium]